MNLEQYKKFLPSKKFTKVIGLGTAVLVFVLLISAIIGSRNSFGHVKSGGSLTYANGTVGALVTVDSNGNGIPDWEEKLWGLDPTADGLANKKIIDQKKAANTAELAADSAAAGNAPSNATDDFTNQLMTTVLALEQSGSLTPNAVANLAESIDGNVDAKHAKAPVYTIVDIKVLAGAQAKTTYRASLKKVIDSYTNVEMGSELSLIADGLKEGGDASLQKLDTIANAYTELSKKIIALPTPRDAIADAINLANATGQMGASLKQVEVIHTDVLTGMVGVDDYLKASDISDQASLNLKNYFGS